MFDRPAFCDRISALLKEKKISKTKFYSDCEITSAAFSLWNTEKAMPLIQNIEKMADYLNVPIEALLIDKYELLMKLLRDYENGQTVKTATAEDQMSYTEHVLVNCWRRASEDDRDIITAVLKKYGFSYSSEKIEETMAVS